MDVISLLRDVKQAEEDKARALEKTRAAAEKMVAELSSRESIEESVCDLLAEAEAAIRSELEASTNEALTRLDRWQGMKRRALAEAAGARTEAAFAFARDTFASEWLPPEEH